MFDYQKVMLQKSSYNNEIFKEELQKSIVDLKEKKDELAKFKYWVIDNFYHTHYEEINDVIRY